MTNEQFSIVLDALLVIASPTFVGRGDPVVLLRTAVRDCFGLRPRNDGCVLIVIASEGVKLPSAAIPGYGCELRSQGQKSN